MVVEVLSTSNAYCTWKLPPPRTQPGHLFHPRPAVARTRFSMPLPTTSPPFTATVLHLINIDYFRRYICQQGELEYERRLPTVNIYFDDNADRSDEPLANC
jgi:hypothetical protein